MCINEIHFTQKYHCKYELDNVIKHIITTTYLKMSDTLWPKHILPL